MPAPCTVSSLNPPYFLPTCNWLLELAAAVAADLDTPCELVLTLGSIGDLLLPVTPPGFIHESAFPNEPPMPRAKFMVEVVAACCCVSVAFASACRLCSFLVPFLTSTSGARSPGTAGVPGADVPRDTEPDLAVSPAKAVAAARRARFVARSSSSSRSRLAILCRA